MGSSYPLSYFPYWSYYTISSTSTQYSIYPPYYFGYSPIISIIHNLLYVLLNPPISLLLNSLLNALLIIFVDTIIPVWAPGGIRLNFKPLQWENGDIYNSRMMWKFPCNAKEELSQPLFWMVQLANSLLGFNFMVSDKKKSTLAYKVPCWIRRQCLWGVSVQ